MLRRRAGFTLIEMIIVLSIIAVLGGTLLTSLARRPGEAAASSLAETLDAVAEGILAYRSDVRRYPTELLQLSTQPAAGAADLCGRQTPADFVSSWRGPYLGRPVTGGGAQVGGSTVQNALEQSPAVFGIEDVGTLTVVVLQVDSVVAVELENAFETTQDLASGTVRWTSAGSGMGTLRYAVPVRGC